MSKSVYSNPEYHEKVEEINSKNSKYMDVKKVIKSNNFSVKLIAHMILNEQELNF